MVSMRVMMMTFPALAFAAGLNVSQAGVSGPMLAHDYSKDCWKKSDLRVIPGAAAMLQTDKPGAGITKFEPFETVLKDGFLKTECVKDYMYYRGDKFGDNKYDYKLGPVSNVSIVHYDAFVPREDRKQMTQKVCFEFCRTVPQMGFFGIVNGRNCYCTPYYQPMASDSSQCDAVCEGEKSLFCGGKSKSSVFTMHMCANTEKELADKVSEASSLQSNILAKAKKTRLLGNAVQAAGEAIMDIMGQVGDTGVTNQGMNSLKWAGKFESKSKEASKIADALGDLVLKSAALKDFTDPETVTKAERVMEGIDKTVAKGKTVVEEMDEIIEMAMPTSTTKDAGKQYYPVMYFVDKEYDEVPSSCDGDMVLQPMIGDKDTCATACDAQIHDCVGFQFYSLMGGERGCVLLKNFKTGVYYTGCEENQEPEKKVPEKKVPTFLQKKKMDFNAHCYAKFSKFEGTSLAVDPEGKCKQCFNELTKADRCF